MVSLRVLRSGSAGRSGRLFFGNGRLADNGSQSFWIRLGCRRHGKLQSFFSIRDCSQHIPSRSTTHDRREQLCLGIDPGKCGFIYCEFLTVRATPYTATCGRASTIAGESHRIQGPTRVGPNGRDLKLPEGNSDRTTGRNFSLSFLVRLWRISSLATIQLTWAEGRALLGSNPSAVQGPTPNGAARCRPLPFGIGTQALNPSCGREC